MSGQEVYEELLQRVGESNPRPRIQPAQRFAQLLGDPQNQISVIQIAGTNGKTSTARILESLLRAQGLRTGLLTSPHLISFRERFCINGEPVSEEELTETWQNVQPALENVDAELEASGQSKITFFEAVAVLAYELFADSPVDVAIIETGMGGMWDATNIVEHSLAVFTPIDLDHTRILGDSVEEIARTKAGVLHPAGRAVSARQSKEALFALQQRAQECEGRLYTEGADFEIYEDMPAVGGRLVSLRGLSGHPYDPCLLPLFGAHQSQNALLALAAAELFLFDGQESLSQEVLEEGLAQATSPGRMQPLGTHPAVYVDAAHNPHGIRALTKTLRDSFNFQEIAVVFGVFEDKDAASMLQELLPHVQKASFVPVESDRSLDFDHLYELAERYEHLLPAEEGITVGDSLEDAIESLRNWAELTPDRAVIIVGSVVLAGQTLAYASTQEWAVSHYRKTRTHTVE